MVPTCSNLSNLEDLVIFPFFFEPGVGFGVRTCLKSSTWVASEFFRRLKGGSLYLVVPSRPVSIYQCLEKNSTWWLGPRVAWKSTGDTAGTFGLDKVRLVPFPTLP